MVLGVNSALSETQTSVPGHLAIRVRPGIDEDVHRLVELEAAELVAGDVGAQHDVAEIRDAVQRLARGGELVLLGILGQHGPGDRVDDLALADLLVDRRDARLRRRALAAGRAVLQRHLRGVRRALLLDDRDLALGRRHLALEDRDLALDVRELLGGRRLASTSVGEPLALALQDLELLALHGELRLGRLLLLAEDFAAGLGLGGPLGDRVLRGLDLRPLQLELAGSRSRRRRCAAERLALLDRHLQRSGPEISAAMMVSRASNTPLAS